MKWKSLAFPWRLQHSKGDDLMKHLKMKQFYVGENADVAAEATKLPMKKKKMMMTTKTMQEIGDQSRLLPECQL